MLNRIFIGLVMLVAFCLPAMAADGKAELALVGEFIQTDVEDEENPWAVQFSALFPAGQYILLGPVAAIGNDEDLNRLGGGLEWNLNGPKGGLFIGADALYFQTDADGLDRHVVTAKAGFKIPVGSGAAIKLYAVDVVDGRGEDATDLSFGAGVIARF